MVEDLRGGAASWVDMRDRTGDPQLGRRIREARLQAGLTQAAVVARMPSAPEGRDQRWLSNIETAAARLRVDELPELVQALSTDEVRVSADYLLGLDPELSRLPLSMGELDLIHAWRVASPEGRAELRATARVVARFAGRSGSTEDSAGQPRPRRVAEE